MGLAARAQSLPDPCGAATFNEQACHEAVRANGYCWNGKWVRLKYRYAFPYYYDLYADYMAQGGLVIAGKVGTCGPSHATIIGCSAAGMAFPTRGLGRPAPATAWVANGVWVTASLPSWLQAEPGVRSWGEILRKRARVGDEAPLNPGRSRRRYNCSKRTKGPHLRPHLRRHGRRSPVVGRWPQADGNSPTTSTRIITPGRHGRRGAIW